jgi:hypothetical protein
MPKTYGEWTNEDWLDRDVEWPGWNVMTDEEQEPIRVKIREQLDEQRKTRQPATQGPAYQGLFDHQLKSGTRVNVKWKYYGTLDLVEIRVHTS